MVETLLKQLRGMLVIEQKSNWPGTTVAGGFSLFGSRWAGEAADAGLDPVYTDQIAAWLDRYDLSPGEERARIAAQILEALEQPEYQDVALAHVDQIGGAVHTPAPQPARRAPSRRERSQSDPSRSAELHRERLQEPVSAIQGVGEARSEQLARLGIHTFYDLIWHLPRRHDDFSLVQQISDIQAGDSLAVVASLSNVFQRKLAMNRTLLQATFHDGSGSLRATWFNQPWKARELKEGKLYRLMGKVDLYMGHKTLSSPEIEQVRTKALAKGSILPVYPLTEGLRSSQLNRLIQKALDYAGAGLEDPLPETLRQEHHLIELLSALWQIHAPQSMEELQSARRRLAFDELFFIQLGVQRRRQLLQASTAQPLAYDESAQATFKAALPFTLTAAQERTLDEIRRDIQRTVPMSRMVQGDVGSGKTVVAAGAMYAAALNRTQSALLAPTQILAEQHHRGLSRVFAHLRRADGQPVQVALLTGRVTGNERAQILAGLESGEIDIVVGTTALIQEGVLFNDLAFVVIDEQHRFGVAQRGNLRSKGRDDGQVLLPHLLVMSATPIPRSLALTIYGDLDISVINELPPGRQEVKTKHFMPAERERLYSFLRREVQAGRQGYIVYPLVEESDSLEAGAAVEAYERLSKQIFPECRLGLLHGRLSGKEKDEVMQRFADRELDILVSTTVIEVGIDVPNASVIYIEDAERFGLAQLHQLRGRVGRGAHQSYCGLISPARNSAAQERINALVETNDGFKLAEKDLELRGPGEFLGTRQSGLPDLRMAQLSDTEILSTAQQAAANLFAQDPDLSRHPQLRAKVAHFWHGHGDLS